ncbi:MAG: hypothetical protein ACLGI9_01365, partial [Thermoanaerobaculia bacterium]
KGGPMTPTASATCGGPSSASCDNFKLTIAPPSYAFQVVWGELSETVPEVGLAAQTELERKISAAAQTNPRRTRFFR